MHISSYLIGEDRPMVFPKTHQLNIRLTLGLPTLTRLRVVFRSASRNDTSYEIFDQHGASMGSRQFLYCFGLVTYLIEDLNVLLNEFGLKLELTNELEKILKEVRHTCEVRYGNGIEDGDAVMIIE